MEADTELFLKIRAADLSEKVYERLKKAITMSVIKPGERIDINALSDKWGVSRTPVKDAIVRLSGEGLVEVKAKVGTYATRFTANDMLELFSIRLMLEGGIAEAVIQHATDESLQQLEQTQHQLEALLLKDTFDYFSFNDWDARFHELLIETAGNRKLLDLYRSLHFHTQVARFYYYDNEDKSEQTLREHREIIDAIRSKDAGKLAQAIVRHIESGRAGVRELIREGNSETL